MQPTRRVHLKSTVAQPGATAAIVRLNIGGVRYLSTAQTLAQGENFFSALLSGKIPSLVDDEGYFFIDRDGRLFHYLLEFLRTGRLKVPPGVDEQDLVAEARFYSIDLHAFSPLSDAALLRWLEEKQSNLSMVRRWAIWFSSLIVFRNNGRDIPSWKRSRTRFWRHFATSSCTARARFSLFFILKWRAVQSASSLPD